jgi:diacylglycerol kinase (ATP)
MVRFYLHKRDNSSELSVPMFVGNLPVGLSQIQYEKILMDTLMKNVNDASAKWSRFDVIYYEYGSMVMLYDDPEKAVKAYKILKDSYYENKQLMVLLLPTIQVGIELETHEMSTSKRQFVLFLFCSLL